MYVARLPNNRRNVTRCRVSNSRSNTKITRLILFAGALLALLLLASPMRHVAHAQSLPDEMIDYAEGDTAPVEAFTAVDPEGESITWTKSGTDVDDFTLEDGVLKFVNTPDYENPTDIDQNNTYSVTVSASDGTDGGDASDPSTQTLRITILNLEEPGTVDLSQRQPQVANALTATLTDPDADEADDLPIVAADTDLTVDATWKWERSRNGRTGWTEIEVVTDSDNQNQNPNANVYTPVEDDEGYFLRATASYDDGEGEDKTAEMVSYLAVRPIPYSNNTPVFLDAEGEDLASAERSVAENSEAGAPVGDPVQATDAAETGPDVLTYTLNNTDTFSIDSATGQIEVGAGTTLDFDTQPIRYDVTVTATDPSGLDDTIDVTIKITDVNETPVVTVDSDNTERTPDENFGINDAVATFGATDEERSDLTWSLSGADSGDFKISSSGVLTFESDPNFEAPADANRDNVYEVTAQASDGVNTGTLDITVTVGNVEEAGTVTLSNRQPEDDVPITAMLSDPDVAVQSSVEWQWEDNQGEISGATSATFRPIGGDQVNETLTAKATYTDGHGPNKMAEGNSANTVQATDTDNEAPEFKDDDGDAITAVDLEVPENTAAGQNVDEPVVAKDERPDGQGGTTVDDTQLTYSLENRDYRLFEIDPGSGQIKVGEGTTLDFETKSSYVVTVKVKDASNASDTVTANISVTNVEEDPEITAGPTAVNYAERGTGTVATYTAADPEDDSARPRKPLAWSLAGLDNNYFTIDGGALKFKTPPDFEDEQDSGSDNVYNVEVTVTDSAAGTTPATRQVAVTVTNVEEPGTVTLSAEQPQDDVAVTATLADPDNVTADSEMWQWARSRTRSSGWTDIVDEDEDAVGKTATYTPVNDDMGYYLRATVTYKDGESDRGRRRGE